MRAAKTLAVCLFVLVSLISAHADNIVFNTAVGGTWSYAGPGGNFSGTALDPTTGGFQINGGPFTGLADLSIAVVTGNTTATGPGIALFSSTGSTFTVSSSAWGTIFSGTLSDASLNLAAQGATGPIFNATFIVGTFNSAFVNFYGMEPLFQGTGKTTFNLAGVFNSEAQSGGDVNGSVSDLTQVPEPASLALLGSGLLATGGFIRRKLIA
jgi:hypothetical protein